MFDVWHGRRTGRVQINGRDELEIPVKAVLDGEYVKKLNFGFDCKCYFGTVVFVLRFIGECGRRHGSNEKAGGQTGRRDCVDMKKILITGAGSFIGTSFENYIKKHYPANYTVDIVDMVDGTWREKSFSGYDSVFHVAGIAHSDNAKLSTEREALYYAVNTDMAIETAKKAKADGAKQFILMSSAIVYGDSAPMGKSKVITADTPVSPANCYGDSKVKAEYGIRPLNDDAFKVVILRSPMIYGKGSKGNYPLLSKLAKKMLVFPDVKNQRSMLYIENLCEFVRLMVENGEQGTFWPQNRAYSNTSQMVQMIARTNGKRVRLIKGFGWALRLLSYATPLVNKAFGNLSYAMEISEYPKDYRKWSLQDSIKETEV